MSGPEYIILSLDGYVDKFEQRLKRLSYYELDTEDVITNILEYIACEQTANSYLLEYIQEIKDLYSFAATEVELLEIETAFEELGLFLIHALRKIRAYNSAGELWYAFAMLIGEDLYLKMVDPNNK